MTNLFEDSKYGHVKIWKVFYLMYWSGGWWFRFFNKWGVHAKDMTRNMELFSERYGYKKYIQIGNWRFSFLK